MKQKRVEFTPPAEFALPEGVTEGEDFDAVCTFRVKGEGTVCLVQMGDAKMPGYDGKEAASEPKSKPGYGEYAKGMMGEMPASTTGYT